MVRPNMMECQWQQQDGGKNELAQNWWLEVLATPDPSEGVDGDTPSSHEVMHEASRQSARARLTFQCASNSALAVRSSVSSKKGEQSGWETKWGGGNKGGEEIQKKGWICGRRGSAEVVAVLFKVVVGFFHLSQSRGRNLRQWLLLGRWTPLIHPSAMH